ncbi:uncharacterized protein V1516DRAFT_685339 [Lipomyces oligophaga]|uniref:uncharacterized protein n=1 Tax=Lipomyces oligophaga TaxID=45792 RepID=UPI0034CD54D8
MSTEEADVSSAEAGSLASPTIEKSNLNDEPPMIDYEREAAAAPEVDYERTEMAKKAADDAASAPLVPGAVSAPTAREFFDSRKTPSAGGITPVVLSTTPVTKKRICGLSRMMFYIVLVIVIIVVLAIALGAGLGAGLKNKSSSSDSSNVSSTSSITSTTNTISTSTSAVASSTTAATLEPQMNYVSATKTYSKSEATDLSVPISDLFCVPSTNVTMDPDFSSSYWNAVGYNNSGDWYGFTSAQWVDHSSVGLLNYLMPDSAGTLLSVFIATNLSANTNYTYRVSAIIDIGENYDHSENLTALEVDIYMSQDSTDLFQHTLVQNFITQPQIDYYNINDTTIILSGNFTTPKSSEIDNQITRLNISVSAMNQVTILNNAAIISYGEDDGCDSPDPMVSLDALLDSVTSYNLTDNLTPASYRLLPATEVIGANDTISAANYSMLFCLPNEDGIILNPRMAAISDDSWLTFEASSDYGELNVAYSLFSDSSAAGLGIPMVSNFSYGTNSPIAFQDMEFKLSTAYTLRSTFTANVSSDADLDADYIAYEMTIFMGSDTASDSGGYSFTNATTLFYYNLTQAAYVDLVDESVSTYFTLEVNFTTPDSLSNEYQNAARLALSATPNYQESHFITAGIYYAAEANVCSGPDPGLASSILEHVLA